ncbi:MAG: hypothetical protein HQK81_14435 [Desulfovibrionaceae bacterium]|nr:hypothetical protein [Desulfovibrionaceae bacterium]
MFDIVSKYDGEKLQKLIEEGNDAKQIMTVLGISLVTLKSHQFKLMNEKKAFFEIPGIDSRIRSTRPTYKKGKILITSNMLGDIKFDEGQKFNIQASDSGLVLEKV